MEVVESNTSEPVIDVKLTEEAVETETEAPKKAEGEEVEAEADAEPEKKLSKAEQVQQEYEAKLERERKAFQKRIDRKTAAEKQALEERQKLQSELEELRRVAPTIDDAPKEEDFDSFDDFVEAKAKHQAEKIVQERIREQKEAELRLSQQREYESNIKDFQEKEQAFRAENPDYDKNSEMFAEQVEYLQKAYPNNQSLVYAREMLLSSDVSPAIINELGTNPDIAEEWASMKPVQVAREVFKLEMRLSEAKREEETPLPKPVKTVKGSTTPKRSLDKMDASELMKWVKS